MAIQHRLLFHCTCGNQWTTPHNPVPQNPIDSTMDIQLVHALAIAQPGTISEYLSRLIPRSPNTGRGPTPLHITSASCTSCKSTVEVRSISTLWPPIWRFCPPDQDVADNTKPLFPPLTMQPAFMIKGDDSTCVSVQYKLISRVIYERPRAPKAIAQMSDKDIATAHEAATGSSHFYTETVIGEDLYLYDDLINTGELIRIGNAADIVLDPTVRDPDKTSLVSAYYFARQSPDNVRFYSASFKCWRLIKVLALVDDPFSGINCIGF